VGIQRVTPDLAAALGLKETRGVAINSVTPGGPADKAGLRAGDVIVALDGQQVTEGNALRNRIAGSQPGTEVTLTIVREGKEQQVRATLGEFRMPEQSGQPQTRGEGGSAPTGRLGVGVQPLTPEAASQLGLPRGTSGVLVASVEPGGPAAEAGIRPGDVIMEVNRKPVGSTSELSGALAQAGSEPVLMLINRGGQTLFTTARLRR
jgi:S1-C subfamily serine protease